MLPNSHTMQLTHVPDLLSFSQTAVRSSALPLLGSSSCSSRPSAIPSGSAVSRLRIHGARRQHVRSPFTPVLVSHRSQRLPAASQSQAEGGQEDGKFRVLFMIVANLAAAGDEEAMESFLRRTSDATSIPFIVWLAGLEVRCAGGVLLTPVWGTQYSCHLTYLQ